MAVEIMTDREVAELLKVSVGWVRKCARRGPSRPGGLDLRLADPIVVGDMRRWERRRVDALIARSPTGGAGR